MSTTDTCFEAFPPASSFAAETSGGTGWPVHCATEMEIVVPAVGATAVGYTFEPAEGPVQLPPVWRCACGFQLDVWATGWPGPSPEPLTPEQLLPVLTGTLAG
jgi:hypothetical protein